MMFSIARSPQEALVLGVLAAGLLAFVLAGLMRWRRTRPVLADLLVPTFLLVGYWITYNKIPPFPPVGAVNKVFYVIAGGAVLGLVLNLTGRLQLVRALLVLLPVVSAVYLGITRLTVAPLEVAAAALLGALALCLLSAPMNGPQGEADIKRAIVLVVACIGFAPIALFGASSSSFQLCLAFAAAICGILFWNLTNPAFSFGPASMLGGAGGMIAVAQTVTLITREADLTALAVLGLVFLAPLISNRALDRVPAKTKAIRIALFTGLCLPPPLVAVAIVVTRYGANFPM